MRRRIRKLSHPVRLPVPTIGLAMAGGGGAAPAVQVDGTLAVCADVAFYVCPGASILNAVYIYCEDPGTAGSTIIDVHLNGVTVFTVQANRPTLAWNDADQVAKSGVPDLTALAENDVLSFHIDQVATGAEDLVIVPDVDLVVGLVGPPGASGAAHNILDGVVHTDSALDIVSRGSLIIGNALLKWDELVKGAVGRVLTAGALDISWEEPASGVPSGLIAIFDDDCPPDWTRVAAFDNKFLRGNAAYGGGGGTATHTHPYTDVIAHDHDITDGGHAHDIRVSHDISSNQLTVRRGYTLAATLSGIVESAVTGITIDEEGITPGETDAAGTLPPYIEVIFCKKD